MKSPKQHSLKDQVGASCEYEFTLALTGAEEFTDAIMDKLYKAGCDDATFVVRYGRMFGVFSRKAGSMMEAVLSAIAAVRSVGFDVLMVNDSSLVTIADIARKSNRSRQLIHHYMTGKRGSGGFPGPACEISNGVFAWDWCQVAGWMFKHSMITQECLENAEVVNAVNKTLDIQRLRKCHKKLAAEVMRAI